MILKRIDFKKVRFTAFLLALVLVSLSLSAINTNAETAVSGPVISNGYLRGVKAGQNCSDLKSAYTSDMHGCSYELFSNESYISASNVAHIVSTGDCIIDSRGNEFTVVVSGDIDGDGFVTITDAAVIKMHFSGSVTLTDALYLAADTTFDNSVSATDYLRMKFHLQGNFNIYENETHIPDELSSSAAENEESGWTSNWV